MKKYLESADYIRERISISPKVGIILGSGLGKLANSITDKEVIPYAQIPNFLLSTAPGHQGNLIAGRLGGKEVICMQGRFHYYEGYGMEQVICIECGRRHQSQIESRGPDDHKGPY